MLLLRLPLLQPSPSPRKVFLPRLLLVAVVEEVVATVVVDVALASTTPLLRKRVSKPM